MDYLAPIELGLRRMYDGISKYALTIENGKRICVATQASTHVSVVILL